MASTSLSAAPLGDGPSPVVQVVDPPRMDDDDDPRADIWPPRKPATHSRTPSKGTTLQRPRSRSSLKYASSTPVLTRLTSIPPHRLVDPTRPEPVSPLSGAGKRSLAVTPYSSSPCLANAPAGDSPLRVVSSRGKDEPPRRALFSFSGKSVAQPDSRQGTSARQDSSTQAGREDSDFDDAASFNSHPEAHPPSVEWLEPFASPTCKGPGRCKTATFSRAPRDFPATSDARTYGSCGPYKTSPGNAGQRQVNSKLKNAPVVVMATASRESCQRLLGVGEVPDPTKARRGPADYKIETLGATGKEAYISTFKSPTKASMPRDRRRWFNDVLDPKPGPQEYETAVSGLNKAGVAKIGKALRDMDQPPPPSYAPTPGPGTFELRDRMDSRAKTSPSYRFPKGKRSELAGTTDQIAAPGPGQYHAVNVTAVKPKIRRAPSVAFSTSKRFNSKLYAGLIA